MSHLVTENKDANERVHSLRTDWLNSRILQWMAAEAFGLSWWICSFTSNGKFITASYDGVWTPGDKRIDYARRVALHINKNADYGGAWITGWAAPTTFFMIWKDMDGDIQLQNIAQKPFSKLREWKMSVWEESAHKMYAQWCQAEEVKEQANGQGKRLAQGEDVSDTHKALADAGFEISVDPVLDGID